MSDFILGSTLSKLLYEEVAKPTLERYFPQVDYSAALLGWGSEVLGYDDLQSTHHNWGPRFLLFLSEWNRQQYEKAISGSLSEHLPYHFLGYSTNFSPADEGGVRLPLFTRLVGKSECYCHFRVPLRGGTRFHRFRLIASEARPALSTESSDGLPLSIRARKCELANVLLRQSPSCCCGNNSTIFSIVLGARHGKQFHSYSTDRYYPIGPSRLHLSSFGSLRFSGGGGVPFARLVQRSIARSSAPGLSNASKSDFAPRATDHFRSGAIHARYWLWDNLTARETQIARMVANGKRNAEVAPELQISPYMVETHLKHIYTKLNVRLRTELGHVVRE